MITEAILALIFLATCFGAWYSRRSDYWMQNMARLAELDHIKTETRGIRPAKTMELRKEMQS